MTERSETKTTKNSEHQLGQITMEELMGVLGEDWHYRKSRMGRYLLSRYDGLFIDKIEIFIGKKKFFVRSGPNPFQCPTAEQNYFEIKGLQRVKVFTRTKQILAEGTDSSIIVDLQRGSEQVRLLSRSSRVSAQMMTFAHMIGTDDFYSRE